MQNILEYILFLILAGIVRLFGINVSRRLSIIIALFFFYVIPIRKQVTLANLRKAFPDLNDKKIRKIAFGSYKNFSITLVEILAIPSMTREQIEKAIDCPERNIVKKRFEENNGLIVLSGHFGNWEYIALSVSAQINIPFHVVVKSQRNPFVNDFLNRCRTRWINKVIPLGASIRQVYAELSSKHIVAMVADQRGPENGMRVNFFGMSSSIYPGPAQLALKTRAPILFGITVRQSDYSYKGYLHEISFTDLPEDKEMQIQEVSRRHIELLEFYIRKHPEHWLWMHNIWKY